MSIQTKFEIDGLVRNVLDFSYKLTQPTDSTGRPLAEYTGGIFKVILEGDRETDLYEWAIASDMMKKCKLTHASRFGTGKSTIIALMDAYCVAYEEHISSIDDAPYTIEIMISPATMIQNGTVIFSKSWRKTDPYREEVPVTVREDSEPEMLGSYYEDKSGNKIPDHKIKIGDEVYLVIKSRNAVGKSVTIDLADNSRDFEHNGEVLENDVLDGITIKSDTQKVALKVVTQQTTK